MSGSPELISPEFPFPEASAISHEILMSFKKDCAIRGMAAGSIPRYLSVIKIFCKFLDERGLNLCGVDRAVPRDFLEYPRLENGMPPIKQLKIIS